MQLGVERFLEDKQEQKTPALLEIAHSAPIDDESRVEGALNEAPFATSTLVEFNTPLGKLRICPAEVKQDLKSSSRAHSKPAGHDTMQELTVALQDTEQHEDGTAHEDATAGITTEPADNLETNKEDYEASDVR